MSSRTSSELVAVEIELCCDSSCDTIRCEVSCAAAEDPVDAKVVVGDVVGIAAQIVVGDIALRRLACGHRRLHWSLLFSCQSLMVDSGR